MQEKKLSVQEEQNLTSKLFAKGREWVDSAAAHVDTVQDTLTVSANLGSHTPFQSSHTPHHVYTCTLANQHAFIYIFISPCSSWSGTEMSSFCGPVSSGAT